MSTFSDKEFDANGYNSSRPTYPKSFYKILNDYIIENQSHQKITVNQRALDIGCGPGTATFQMVHYLDNFTEYWGSDLSPVMIQQAQHRLDKTTDNDIPMGKQMHFTVGSYDEANDEYLNKLGKFNLVTAVECVHWFDFDLFQDHIYDNLLLEGGVLAIWGYADAILVDYPDLDQLTDDLSYAEDQLGPYWQQPGRRRLRTMLRENQFNTDKFKNVKEKYYMARDSVIQNSDNKGQFTDVLDICKTCTLRQYEGYIKTFSAYLSWKQDPANSEKPDPCETYIDEVIKRHDELTRDSQVRISWNTFYKFATKRQ